jgi:hypothetical protein
MARLAARIAQMGQGSPELAGVTSATPAEMPVALVTYEPVQTYPWGVAVNLRYQDLHPYWTAAGGYSPARDNGGWGPVKPAGRP